MTDRTLDPRDDRLDDDAPRDPVTDVAEPVVDLDALTHEEAEGEESSDDKYIQVIDGRPETLGFEKKGSPAGES